MNNFIVLSSLLLAGVSALSACGDDGSSATGDDGTGDDGSGSNPGPDAGSSTVMLDQDITSDTTLTADKTYLIPRMKYLYVKNGATLTIQPGTVIQGGMGSVLVITRGAKINATGTVDKPITLTTDQPAGSKTAGYWGGLLVLGKATINVNVNSTPPSTDAEYEAFTSAQPEGMFGGTDDADNSGTIKYVRIEFAGFSFIQDREFNNLTLCGVGSGTTVDFVQVHGGSDDGIEIFGGAVNVKHILSSQNQDDGFDTDNGWHGKAQFVIVQNIAHPTVPPEATNGYESDNHGTAASYEASPRTLPTVYNVTLVGDKDIGSGGLNFAGVFRRGTGGHYFNQLWTNFQQGLIFRDTATQTQLSAGNLSIKNSILFGNGTNTNQLATLSTATGTTDFDASTYVYPTSGNTNLNVDPGMPASMMSKTAPTFKPNASSPALTATNAATPPNDGFFDATATFIGAVGATDWTTGWTSYPQN
ncbi:MAG TPA: hypothetical protein VGM39_12290 [Kofleriaceae bacterium]|jgi:hypothetical protein